MHLYVFYSDMSRQTVFNWYNKFWASARAAADAVTAVAIWDNEQYNKKKCVDFLIYIFNLEFAVKSEQFELLFSCFHAHIHTDADTHTQSVIQNSSNTSFGKCVCWSNALELYLRVCIFLCVRCINESLRIGLLRIELSLHWFDSAMNIQVYVPTHICQ